MCPLYISLGSLDLLLKPNQIDLSNSSGLISTLFKEHSNSNHKFNSLITDRLVRGFVVGATNPLLRSASPQNQSALSEVIVTTLPVWDGIPANFQIFLPNLTQMSEKQQQLAAKLDKKNEINVDKVFSFVSVYDQFVYFYF